MIAQEQSASSPPLVELNAIRDVLVALYRELDATLASKGPICQLSGRCCRFKEFGHTLFLSAPEAMVLVADAPQPQRGIDGGETCPWQDDRGHCTAREARPLGCRVYYCDPAFESEAPALSEVILTKLKHFATMRGWPWNYAPLHQHLRQAQAEGRLKFAPPSSSTGLEDSAESHGPSLFS